MACPREEENGQGLMAQLGRVCILMFVMHRAASLLLSSGNRPSASCGRLDTVHGVPAADGLPRKPGGPGARTVLTPPRLVALALALLILGFLAPPRPVIVGADDGATEVARGTPLSRRSFSRLGTATASVYGLDESPGGPAGETRIVVPPKPDITHRAGCCGAASASCPGPYPHLLVYVAIPNAWRDADRRHPLRTQWAKSLALMDKRMKAKGLSGPTPQTVLHFVIGLQGLDDSERAAVDKEAAAHNDLLVLPNVPDRDSGEPTTRSSTTLKVLHSVAYAASHYTFDFYARIGDDAYLRVDYLAELILINHAYPLERAYIGYKFGNHHIPGSQSTHNFIVGMGFFLTQDLARFVCRERDLLLDGFPEDGIVGSWFVGTKVDVIHEPRFHDIDHVTTVAYAPCSNTSLVLHHMWTRKNWEAIDGEGLLQC